MADDEINRATQQAATESNEPAADVELGRLPAPASEPASIDKGAPAVATEAVETRTMTLDTTAAPDPPSLAIRTSKGQRGATLCLSAGTTSCSIVCLVIAGNHPSYAQVFSVWAALILQLLSAALIFFGSWQRRGGRILLRVCASALLIAALWLASVLTLRFAFGIEILVYKSTLCKCR